MPPTGKLGMVKPGVSKVVVLKLPGQEAPPLEEHVMLSLTMPALTGSVTTALLTVAGPLLVTVMTWLVTPPWGTVVVPLVLVIAKSAVGVANTEVAVPVLLSGVGSVKPAGTDTVAVLVILPALTTTPVITIVNCPPLLRAARVSAMALPEPLTPGPATKVSQSPHAAGECAGPCYRANVGWHIVCNARSSSDVARA